MYACCSYTHRQNIWHWWPVYDVKCLRAEMREGELPLPPALQYLIFMIVIYDIFTGLKMPRL